MVRHLETVQKLLRGKYLYLFFLQGCVSIPHQELAPIATTSGLDGEAKEAFAAGITADGWPNPEWWKAFEDPTLDSVIDSALRCSPTLKLAEQRLQAARQSALEKRSALFPEVNFDGNDNYQHFSKNGFFRSLASHVPAVLNDITLSLTYSWEIDFWGKNRKILTAAIGQIKAAEAEKDAAKLILTTSIAYSYVELQFLLRKKELLEQKHRNESSICKIEQGRQTGAIGTSISTLSADLELINKEANLVDVDVAIQNHLHELKALSGLGQEANLGICKTEFKGLSASLPASISLDLLSRRPDLSAQKQRVEAAAILIGAAKTDFYPSVNLLGFAGLESLTWDKIFQRASFNGSLQPALHLPIFTAGRIKAQLQEKVALFNSAVESYNGLILQAAKEVADHLSAYLRIQKELDLRIESLDVLAKLEAIAQRRFEHALSDRVSWLKIQNNLVDTQLLLTSLDFGKQLANILLIRSLGGGIYE